jgi:hypothetical protein
MTFHDIEEIYRDEERVLDAIGAHEERHLGQIRSVISSAGFPR